MISQIGIPVIRILVLVYFGFGAYLFFNQRNLLYYPDISDPSVCAEFEKSGVNRVSHGETVAYHKENGGTLVVLYHGNGGKACDRLFLARFLDGLGASYLFVEYAGFGDGRKPSEELILHNVRDADAMVGEIPHERLILVGESLGTAPAAYHATLRAPEGIALLSPYTSIADVASAHYPLYPAKFFVKDDFRTDFGEATFGGRLLVVHGRADGIIPFRLGEQVFRDAPFSDKIGVFPDSVGHNDLLASPEVLDALSAFVFASESD